MPRHQVAASPLARGRMKVPSLFAPHPTDVSLKRYADGELHEPERSHDKASVALPGLPLRDRVHARASSCFSQSARNTAAKWTVRTCYGGTCGPRALHFAGGCSSHQEIRVRCVRRRPAAVRCVGGCIGCRVLARNQAGWRCRECVQYRAQCTHYRTLADQGPPREASSTSPRRLTTAGRPGGWRNPGPIRP